eukprot:4001192-Pleurochrysis_carterae.AAC.1
MSFHSICWSDCACGLVDAVTMRPGVPRTSSDPFQEAVSPSACIRFCGLDRRRIQSGFYLAPTEHCDA